MVKKYGDLYLECRRALMKTEDPQTAGLMARTEWQLRRKLNMGVV